MQRFALATLLFLLPSTVYAQGAGCQYLGPYPWKEGGCLVAKDLNSAIASRNPLLNVGTKPHNWVAGFHNGEAVFTQPTFSDITGNLTTGQIPPPSISNLGGVFPYTSPGYQFIYSLDTTGKFASRQPSYLDISGVAAPQQVPFPTTGTIGGVKSKAAVAGTYISGIDNNGNPLTGDLASLSTNVSTTGDISLVGGLYGKSNKTATYPASAASPGWAITSNFVSGNGAANLWNTYTTGKGFTFYQMTGASAATLVFGVSDDAATLATTNMSIYANRTGGKALSNVTLGAADGCGVGFRCMRVPN
jgi:hypothetical protein